MIPIGAETANCKRCRETPVPSNFGSQRKCAFDKNGIFTSDNWNCVTAGTIRTLAGEEGGPSKSGHSLYIYWEDQSYAAVFIPPHPEDVPEGDKCGPFREGGFIAMTWYKHRGQTEYMVRVDPRDGGVLAQAGLPLTASEAEAAIVNLELAKIHKAD